MPTVGVGNTADYNSARSDMLNRCGFLLLSRRAVCPGMIPRGMIPRGMVKRGGFRPAVGCLGAGTLFALIVGSACAPTLVDAGNFPEIPASNTPCVTLVERIQYLDEVTPLGFSAVELLNHVAGAHDSDLTWLEPVSNEEYQLDYGPERGRSTLQLGIAAGEGPVLYEHQEPVLFAPEDTECQVGALKVPVDVTLRSGGQALDETFAATLAASVPYRAHLSKTLARARVGGGVAATGIMSLDRERTFALGGFTLNMELWQGGSRGSLLGQVVGAYAKPSKTLRLSPQPETEQPGLAVWPSDATCDDGSSPIPSDAKVMGFSARDVLEVLTGSDGLQLSWDDGAATPLAIDFLELEDELCQSLADELEFDATLHARTADGRVDVKLPVHVSSAAQGAGIGEIAISSNAAEEPFSPGALATAGIRELNLRDYRSILVEVDASYRGGRGGGSISLRGIDGKSADGQYLSTLITTGRWSR